MTVLLGLIVLALAVARGTRIVTEDTVSGPFRRWLVRRLGETHWLTYLFHCPYCASVWLGLGAGAFACAVLAVSWWWLVPLALVFSQVAVWVTKLDGD